MSTRCSYILIYTTLLFICVQLKYTSSCNYKTPTKLNNILIIIIDDLRHLSEENVYLPNIKKLAEKSIIFKHAYAQQALCAPSRNSILTGRRPDSLRLYDFYSYWRHIAGNYTTLPQLFKENGYHTASVGKVFHPGASSGYTDDYPYSWSVEPYHPSTNQYKDAAVCWDPISRKLQSNLICPVALVNQPEHTLPDIQVLERAVKLIIDGEKSKEPFLLAVGFHKPHIPLKFPKEYLERYPLPDISPPLSPLKPDTMPMVAWHPWSDVRHRDDIRRLNISFPMGTMPEEYTLMIKQSYFAAATYVDDLVGQLLDHVDLQKTVVVLTSDHGWSLGENGLWAKYSNFDVALRVPLTIYSPNLEPQTIPNPVELIDIFPTLVDIVGLKHNITKCTGFDDKTNLCFEGNSLLPLLNGMDKSKDMAFSQYPRPSVNPGRKTDKPRLKDITIMGYSLRNQRFRYTEWIQFNHSNFKSDWGKIFGIELYDHLFDEYEARNVFNVSVYKDLVEHFSVVLKKRFTKTV